MNTNPMGYAALFSQVFQQQVARFPNGPNITGQNSFLTGGDTDNFALLTGNGGDFFPQVGQSLAGNDLIAGVFENLNTLNFLNGGGGNDNIFAYAKDNTNPFGSGVAVYAGDGDDYVEMVADASTSQGDTDKLQLSAEGEGGNDHILLRSQNQFPSDEPRPIQGLLTDGPQLSGWGGLGDDLLEARGTHANFNLAGDGGNDTYQVGSTDSFGSVTTVYDSEGTADTLKLEEGYWVSVPRQQIQQLTLQRLEVGPDGVPIKDAEGNFVVAQSVHVVNGVETLEVNGRTYPVPEAKSNSVLNGGMPL